MFTFLLIYGVHFEVTNGYTLLNYDARSRNKRFVIDIWLLSQKTEKINSFEINLKISNLDGKNVNLD